MNYQKKLKAFVTRQLEAMGYAKRGPEDFLLSGERDIKHLAFVYISKAGNRPMTEVQFGVSSHDLMVRAGFSDLALRAEYIAYVRWTLSDLLGFPKGTDVEYPFDKESLDRLLVALPPALQRGHELSLKIQSVEEIFHQMDADPSVCTVSYEMEEFLRGRWNGTIKEASFAEWKGKSD